MPNTPATGVDNTALEWAAGILGCDRVTVVRGLREGGTPWLLDADGRKAVLRTGQPFQATWFANEALALRVAADAGIPVPAVLGADSGAVSGRPLMLLGHLPGTSRIPRDRDDHRLRVLGALAARINAVPSPDALPARDRPIGEVDFARMRREQGTTPLLRRAEQVIAAGQPAEPGTFVHGDLWQGNILWDGGTLVAVLDWDMAGVGPAGIDFGTQRCDAAILYGADAPDVILAGWEEAAGHPAANVPYWDTVAALCTPPDMAYFATAIADQGRTDLDRLILVERRDDFLRQALARLG